MTFPAPADLQLIGTEIAIRWPDGREDFLPSEFLRARSPSAEQQGERDLLGKLHGGTTRRSYPGVRVTGWDYVGGYAIRFIFSDGHQTGLYSFSYLRGLADEHQQGAR